MRPLFLLALIAGSIGHALAATPAAEVVTFPSDPQILDVRTFGAKGDGRTDDTAALRKACEEAGKKHFRTVYLPDGTYLVSDTFGWRNFLIMCGQSRAGTVIRLKDACPGYGDATKPKAVLRCLYNNNESIGNYLHHLTVDTGSGNPGAIAIRYNSHNQGTCEDVTIRSGDGAGSVGLDLSETEFGPGLIRRVSIDGFDLGIRTPGQPSSATLEHITLSRQRVVGIENRFPLQVRGLTSDNRVPAILNRGGTLTQLVLIDAVLKGGAGDQVAIRNEAGQGLYLRNVASSGYRAALEDGGKEVKSPLAEHISGTTSSLFPSRMASLALPVADPPPTFYEAAEKWRVIDDAAEDDTAAIQQAFDSDAATLCFRSGGRYRISDTVVLRGKARRVVGIMETGISCDFASFGAATKPMVRIAGDHAQAVTWENVGIGAWPNYVYAIELATRRPVHLRGFQSVAGCIIRTAPGAAGGKLFIDEFFNHLQLDHPLDVWIRQCNTENNPFNPKKSRLPTYLANHGARLWVFGLKTESPAIHVVTDAGGRSEILGGFFRDHFAPVEYGGTVPYFRTTDASLTAIYTQYAHAPGKARGLQAEETRAGETRRLTVEEGNQVMGLYSAQPPR